MGTESTVMIRSALIPISAALLLALPSAAAAQDFAGGSIGAGRSSNPVGTSELGFRVANSRITVRGVAIIGCARNKTSEVDGTGSAALNPDGTFSITFTKKRLQRRAVGRSTRRVTVTGQVSGGEIRGRLEATASGAGVRDCKGGMDYVARVPPSLVGDTTPAPAGATLIGMTTGRAGGPFAVNLRVNGDATRITQFVAGSRYKCRTIKPIQETNYSPPIKINPDGTFRFVERFRLPYRDAVERVVVTTEGRFSGGAATGTWQATTTARSRRTRRVIDRCNTGRLSWSASVL